MAFFDKKNDSERAAYVIENFADEQFSAVLVYKHVSNELIQDRSIQIEVDQIAIDSGSFAYMRSGQSIVSIRVWKEEAVKRLNFHCTCRDTSSLRMCEHMGQVLQLIVENEDIRFFFDSTLRKVRLKREARAYGLADEDDLLAYFYAHYIEGALRVLPKRTGLLKFTDENVQSLQHKLLPERTPVFREQKTENKAILIYHHKHYHHLMIQLGELDITSGGKVKAVVKTVDAAMLLWQETRSEYIRFLAAIDRFQQPIKKGYSEADLRALHEIANNPFKMPVYYHGDAHPFHAKHFTEICLQSIGREHLSLEVSKTDVFYQIRLLLQVDGQSRRIADLPILFDCFVYMGKTFYLLKHDSAVRALRFFKSWGGDLLVHESKYQQLQNQLLAKVSDSLSVDYAYLSENNTMVPTDVAGQSPEKIIYLSESESYVVLEPVVRYGSVEVPVRSKRPVYGKDEQGNVVAIRRDEVVEEHFLSLILKQHGYFPEQLADDLLYFYLHQDRFFEENWFLEAFQQWESEQITVMGYDKLSNNKRNPYKAKINIEVTSGIDWFNTKINLSYGPQSVPLKNLEQAVKAKSNYVVLDDGTYGMLPDEWLLKFEAFFNMARRESGLLKTAKTKFQELKAIYAPEMFDAKVKEELLLFEKWQNNEEEAPIETPKGFQGQLRPYQLNGVKWLHSLSRLGFGGCLADDMGLGKSIQVIAFLQLKKEEDGFTNPNLIVVPTTLLTNWLQEFGRFAPSLRVFLWHGAQKNRVAPSAEWDVILTSYGTLVSDIQQFERLKFAHIFLDESQQIKNPASQRYRAANRLRAKTKIALTGTPLENNTFDLFGQLSFTCPGLLGSRRYFRDVYATPIDKFGVSKRLNELLNKIKPFVLRRTKREVMDELPEKTEMVVYCDMGEEQRSIYDLYEREFSAYISAKTDEELSNKSAVVLKGLTRLRQICNSPLLLKDRHFEASGSAKIDWLTEEIKQRSSQHKVLIFSQYIHMLDLVEEAIAEQGLNSVKLTGGIKVKERKALIDRFKREEDLRVFLISLKVGGVGLNLTEADYVYLIDPWWNPAVEDQAIDRVYRIGQRKNVIAVRLICKGTIEEKVLQLQQGKNELFGKLVNSSRLAKTGFSKEALLHLLSEGLP